MITRTIAAAVFLLCAASAAFGANGVDVRVIDKATGQPIPGANLKITLAGRDFEQTADAAGTSRVELSTQQPSYLGIEASAPTYIGQRINWLNYRLGQTVPASETFALERGSVIGGVIHDTAGMPLADVELSISVYGYAPTGKPLPFISDRRVKSGPDGRWQCDGIPPERLDSLLINFVSPFATAYTSFESHGPGGSTKPSDRSILPKFKDQTAVLVRPDVIRAEVSVVGPYDKPVAGARVGSYLPMTDKPTDAAGKCVVEVPTSGPVGLIANAAGYASAAGRWEDLGGAKRAPLVIKLRTGHTLRGRVVDSAGKPIAGVNVNRGTDPTDAEGRFTIADVADEPADYWFNAEQFLTHTQKLRPGKEEHVVTLRRPIRVTGTVVDAQSGKTIDAFKLLPGGQSSPGQPLYFTRGMAGSFTSGAFAVSIHPMGYSHARPMQILRAEAEGYVPAHSQPIPADAEEFRVELKMTRGEGTEAVVLGVDGKPLADVKVYVSTPHETVSVQDGRVIEFGEYASMTSDAEGRVTIPPQPGPFAAIVAHESGFVLKSGEELKKSPELQIAPWGRIEGVVRAGGKPAPGQIVRIDYRSSYYPDKGTVLFSNTDATTDADGRYAFAQVGPMPAKIGRALPNNRQSGFQRTTQEERVDVKPGQTVTVNIGGGADGAGGVTLVGKVKLPTELKDRAATITFSDLSELRLVLPPLPVPENFAKMTNEQKGKWARAYLESPEGKKIDPKTAKRSRFPVTVKSDGSFSVEDLGPGTYDIRIRGLDTSKRTANSSGEEIAKAETIFVIPENFAAKKFDRGELEMESLFNLAVGDAMPDPQLKTLDGKPMKLSDFRGKVVLVDFWATWCGPCVADMPEIKAVYEAFAKDERFVLVSLSLDAETQPAIDYVKKNELKWVQGFLGDWSQTKVPAQFGVRGIPAYFVIGPDGKLIAKPPSGSFAMQEVKAAMAQVK